MSLDISNRSTPVTDVRMLRTRQALRRALLSLLEQKQLDQISVRDIVAAAGVGYATFFRHHATKEDLLGEIAAEQVGRLMELTLPLLDPTDTRVSCLALCDYVDKHRTLWTALLTGGAAGALRAEFIRLATEGADNVRSSNWLPVELGTVFGVSASIEILTWWLRQAPGKYSAAQVAEFVDLLVVAPSTAADRAPRAAGAAAAQAGRPSGGRRRSKTDSR